MADRRMMSKTVIDDDNFLEMPTTAQCLYFHLLLRADDDGFVKAPKSIMRIIGAKEDDMRVLCAKQYVISFESGVIVIRHWKIHNLIKSDRYKPSQAEERKQLFINDDKTYSLMEPKWNQDGTKVEPQVSIGKVSIGKDSVGDTICADDDSTNKKPPKNKYGELENVLLTEKEHEKLVEKYGEDRTNDLIERLSLYLGTKDKRYKSHYAVVCTWARKDEKEGKNVEPKQRIKVHYVNS